MSIFIATQASAFGTRVVLVFARDETRALLAIATKTGKSPEGWVVEPFRAPHEAMAVDIGLDDVAGREHLLDALAHTEKRGEDG